MKQKTYFMTRDRYPEASYKIWSGLPEKFPTNSILYFIGNLMANGIARIDFSYGKEFGLPYIRPGQCFQIAYKNGKWVKVK
jgi:hypothetical protein